MHFTVFARLMHVLVIWCDQACTGSATTACMHACMQPSATHLIGVQPQATYEAGGSLSRHLWGMDEQDCWKWLTAKWHM